MSPAIRSSCRKRIRKVQEQTEGNRYVGIHVALSLDDQEKRPKMNAVIEGGPADRAGVNVMRSNSKRSKGWTPRECRCVMRSTFWRRR